MPEELPGLLRGGVSWGLGTLFAGQGDRSVEIFGVMQKDLLKYLAFGLSVSKNIQPA